MADHDYRPPIDSDLKKWVDDKARELMAVDPEAVSFSQRLRVVLNHAYGGQQRPTTVQEAGGESVRSY